MDHNFFERGITAFIYDLRDVLTYHKHDHPVYIENVGDQVYTDDFQKTFKSEDAYVKNPRTVISFAGMSWDFTGLTNSGIMGKFNLKTKIANKVRTKTYHAKVRRIPCTITFNIQTTTENFLRGIYYMEMITCLLTKNRTFTFKYLDYNNTGSYILEQSPNHESNLTMGFDTERQNRILTYSINIKFQYPAFDVYGRSGHGINDGDAPGGPSWPGGAGNEGNPGDGGIIDPGDMTGGNSEDGDGESMTPDDRRIRQWQHNTILEPTKVTESIYVPEVPATHDPNDTSGVGENEGFN